MARTTIGGWIRQTFGGAARETGKVGKQSIGKPVVTNDGMALGTIAELWRGADAADHAPHDDTLGVGQAEGMLYIPTHAVASASDQEVRLTVDMAQVTARGWRYRPEWLPGDGPGTAPPA
ncbi:MAG: hypothetical protein ACRDG4_17105 [Chloroflexota bacterium]